MGYLSPEEKRPVSRLRPFDGVTPWPQGKTENSHSTPLQSLVIFPQTHTVTVRRLTYDHMLFPYHWVDLRKCSVLQGYQSIVFTPPLLCPTLISRFPFFWQPTQTQTWACSHGWRTHTSGASCSRWGKSIWPDRGGTVAFLLVGWRNLKSIIREVRPLTALSRLY